MWLVMSSWGKGRWCRASTQQVPERRAQEHRLLTLRLGGHNVEKGTTVGVAGTSSKRKGSQTEEWLLFFLPEPFLNFKCPSHKFHLPGSSPSLYIWPLRSAYMGVRGQGRGEEVGLVHACRFFFFFLIMSLLLFIKNIKLKFQDWEPRS